MLKICKLVSGLGKNTVGFFQLWVISKTFYQGRGGQEGVSMLFSMPTQQITFHGGKGKMWQVLFNYLSRKVPTLN